MSVIKVVRLRDSLKSFLGLCLIAVIFVFPDRCIQAAKDGLNLSLYMLLPSLFPFMVVSSYIVNTLRLPLQIKKPIARFLGMQEGCAAPFLLGLISGYPVGAYLTADAVAQQTLSRRDAARLLPLCNACGPLFTVGVVGGGMLGSYTYGYYLYIIQLLGILLCACILKHSAKKFPTREQPPSHKPCCTFPEAVEKSVHAVLNVMGLIIFFSVLTEVIAITGLPEKILPLPSFFYGLLEITTGINRLTLAADCPLRIKLCLSAFLCGFSGVCIFLQTRLATRSANISLLPYVLYKLLIASICAVMAYVCFPLIPKTQTTFSAFAEAKTVLPSVYLTAVNVFIIFLHNIIRICKKLQSNLQRKNR